MHSWAWDIGRGHGTGGREAAGEVDGVAGQTTNTDRMPAGAARDDYGRAPSVFAGFLGGDGGGEQPEMDVSGLDLGGAFDSSRLR